MKVRRASNAGHSRAPRSAGRRADALFTAADRAPRAPPPAPDQGAGAAAPGRGTRTRPWPPSPSGSVLGSAVVGRDRSAPGGATCLGQRALLGFSAWLVPTPRPSVAQPSRLRGVALESII